MRSPDGFVSCDGDVHFNAGALIGCGMKGEIAAGQARAFTHAHEPESRVGRDGGHIESAPVVGDDQLYFLFRAFYLHAGASGAAMTAHIIEAFLDDAIDAESGDAADLAWNIIMDKLDG